MSTDDPLFFDEAIEDMKEKAGPVLSLDEDDKQEQPQGDQIAEEDESLAGGGDIDEEQKRPTPRRKESPGDDRRYEQHAPSEYADYNEQRRRDIAEAKEIHDAWVKELANRESDLESAKNKFREVRKKLREGDEDTLDDDEIEAQQAMIDAHREIDKAKESIDQAKLYWEQQEKRRELSPGAQAWATMNADRYGPDKAFTQEAQKQMQKLVDEGMDPNHPVFYRTLDDRMKRQPRMRPKKRTSSAPVTRGGGKTQEGQSVLSEAQKGFMRDLGQDPDNPMHVANFQDSMRRANIERGKRAH